MGIRKEDLIGLKKEDLTERCSVCGTAVLDGKRVPRGEYNEEGLIFTDTILSRECFVNFYGDQFNVDNFPVKYETCRPNGKS